MKLRDLCVRPCWLMSGVDGFFGEGSNRFSPFFKGLGFSFKGSTFVSKTATIEPRQGNMLRGSDNLLPRDLFPDCVVIKFRGGHMLNCVGLSNPGLEWLLKQMHWQCMKEPLFVSFATVGTTKAQRLAEATEAVELFNFYFRLARMQAGLQINFSCPNLTPGEEVADLKEMIEILQILMRTGMAIVAKVNVLFPIGQLADLAQYCHGICVSNTIPWNDLPAEFRRAVFGDAVSPLARKGYGAGGYSGPFMFSKVVEYVNLARANNITTHINAGGGIRRREDVEKLFMAGASSVALGSVATVRPQRVRKLITRANEIGAQIEETGFFV